MRENSPNSEVLLREARKSAGLSLREAARRLGITHAFLSALELGHKPLRPARRAEIAAAYGLPPQAKLVQPLPSDKHRFLDWLRGQIRWWDSRFILPTTSAVTATVPELYVAPLFRSEDQSIRSSSELLAEFFQDISNRALLLAGGVGSGKSFFLRELTLEIESLVKQAGSPRQYVPFLVSCGEFEITSGSLLLSLVNYYVKLGYEGGGAELESYLRQCFERGSALLLFDGLDERLDVHDRAAAFAWMQRAFEELVRPSGSKMIISGREEVFAEREQCYSGFFCFEIEPWQTTQMFEASAKWSWHDNSQARGFQLILQTNEALFLLSRTPLLFHLLTTLYSSRGVQPFQELVGLYDACCRTLENSWRYARKVLTTGPGGRSDRDLLENYRWLKWRHFLIFLMKYHVLQSDCSPRFTFSAAEVKEAWYAFLSDRGIARQSLEHAQLEGVILSQNTIGPMYYHLERGQNGDLAGRYSFLDQSFGRYYLALALIDEPQQLESRFLLFVRRSEWMVVLALAIQELFRSERVAEQRIAEDLNQLLLRCDDHLGLDSRYGIGKYGLLTAMRGVGSCTLERVWTTTVRPALDLLDGRQELLVRLVWTIIGEQGAAPLLRRYLAEVRQAGGDVIDTQSESRICRHQIVVMAACCEQNFEEAVTYYLKELEDFILNSGKEILERRLSLQRLLWTLPLVGRLFAMERLRPGVELHDEGARSIARATFRVASHIKNCIDSELLSCEFRALHYWNILTALLAAQRKLGYWGELKQSVRELWECIIRHLPVLLTDYPWRVPLLQFMKAAAYNADQLSPVLCRDIGVRLHEMQGGLSAEECIELRIVLKLLQGTKEGLPKGRSGSIAAYEEVFQRPIGDLLAAWIETVTQASSHSLISLATAVCGLDDYYREAGAGERGVRSADTELIKALLSCYTAERLVSDQPQHEEQRFFTRPFTDYCFPLHDHLFNSLTEHARGLAVSRAMLTARLPRNLPC